MTVNILYEREAMGEETYGTAEEKENILSVGRK